MRAVHAVTLIVVTAIAPGCGSKGHAVFPGADARVACRGLVDLSGDRLSADVRWHHPADEGDRRRLDAWCSTVGPGVLSPARSDHTVSVDDVLVVSWNAHAGGGRLADFVRDLRAGRFTNDTPPGGFVLLLQEAVRGGAPVPPTVPDDAPVPDRIQIASPSGNLDDVVSVAEHQGLALLYLPSMRNGRDVNARAEDRGNAILSTFDLSEPTGIELPFTHQRRVAIAATVAGAGPHQRPWRLRVVSVHLDVTTGPRHLWLFTSAHRERQAEHLVAALGDDPIATIVGGDLNTWAGGTREPAFVELEREFPQAETGAQFALGWTLDYLFFRLPPSWSAVSRPADAAFGSDHRPILSRITIGP